MNNNQHNNIQTTTNDNNRLKKITSLLDRVLQATMIFTALTLAILIFAQVLMRYVVQSSFAGIEEIAILFAVWLYFLGMAYATKQKAHIHGGIINLILTDEYKITLIRLFITVICLVCVCIFGYYAAKYGLFVIERNRLSLYLQWPKALWIASMILGFFLMAGYFLLNLYQDIITIKFIQKKQPLSLTSSISKEES